MSTQEKGFSTFFIWFAWTISLGASFFFLVYDVAPAVSEFFSGRKTAMLYLVPCLLIAISGSVVSLFKQKTGVILMLIGGLAIFVDLYFIWHGFKMLGMMISYSGPYFIAALLIAVTRKRA
jgi:hypothetical protein